MVELTGQQYLDAVGATFSVVATTKNHLILIFYDYDSNYIHVEPLKSGHMTDVRDAYARALKFFQKVGFTPRFHRLDDATSDLLEDARSTLSHLATTGPTRQNVPFVRGRRILSLSSCFLWLRSCLPCFLYLLYLLPLSSSIKFLVFFLLHDKIDL